MLAPIKDCDSVVHSAFVRVGTAGHSTGTHSPCVNDPSAWHEIAKEDGIDPSTVKPDLHSYSTAFGYETVVDAALTMAFSIVGTAPQLTGAHTLGMPKAPLSQVISKDRELSPSSKPSKHSEDADIPCPIGCEVPRAAFGIFGAVPQDDA